MLRDVAVFVGPDSTVTDMFIFIPDEGNFYISTMRNEWHGYGVLYHLCVYMKHQFSVYCVNHKTMVAYKSARGERYRMESSVSVYLSIWNVDEFGVASPTLY